MSSVRQSAPAEGCSWGRADVVLVAVWIARPSSFTAWATKYDSRVLGTVPLYRRPRRPICMSSVTDLQVSNWQRSSPMTRKTSLKVDLIRWKHCPFHSTCCPTVCCISCVADRGTLPAMRVCSATIRHTHFPLSAISVSLCNGSRCVLYLSQVFHLKQLIAIPMTLASSRIHSYLSHRRHLPTPPPVL